MMNLTALQAELIAGHPDTGAYDADDSVAAAQLNEPNRPDDISIQDIVKFLLLENTYSTDGNDTQARPLWIRMREVASLAPPETGTVPNPWGSSSVGNLNEIKIVKTQALVEFFSLSAQGALPVDLTDSNFQSYLTGAENAGCLSLAQKNALLALADNLQSRASELGFGLVRTGDVARARAL